MGVLRCTESFAFTDKTGGDRVIAAGALVDEKDPVIKGREHWFEPVEANVERGRKVESASKAPGEKRDAQKPA